MLDVSTDGTINAGEFVAKNLDSVLVNMNWLSSMEHTVAGEF
jgi:hypothetical protein